MTIDRLIRALSREFEFLPESDPVRAAATKTGGLPIYSDMGGILVLLPDGQVVHFDPDTQSIAPVADKRWRAAALTHAARKFPEISSLIPPRPPDAASCPSCGGTGTMFVNITCGICFGLGWVEMDATWTP